MNWRFSDDLDLIDASLAGDWAKLAGKRIFMTGGTGFIGRWMLEALRIADVRHRLGVRVQVLTRHPGRFAAQAPHLTAHEGFDFVAGDVMALAAGDDLFDIVIHAATDASADLNNNDPLRMFDTVVTGTRLALDFAKRAKAERFFYLSSGAVYGAQPNTVSHADEAYLGAPSLATHRSAYAEGKRAAEMLCTIYGKQHGMDIVTARIFALLGPLLSLDIHFAAGNFIRDALAGQPIVVNGAGTAVRSYLYAADLTVWLWSILLRAPAGAVYNVGSEVGVSIADLARRTADILGNAGYKVLGEEDAGWNPGRYVPSTEKIRRELGLSETVDLDEAIRRTAAWNGWKNVKN